MKQIKYWKTERVSGSFRVEVKYSEFLDRYNYGKYNLYFDDEDEQQQIYERLCLFLDMSAFAGYYNRYVEERESVCSICWMGGKFVVTEHTRGNAYVIPVGIELNSREVAELMIKEFGTRIKEVFNLK